MTCKQAKMKSAALMLVSTDWWNASAALKSVIKIVCTQWAPIFCLDSIPFPVQEDAQRLNLEFKDVSQNLKNSHVDLGNERQENLRLKTQVHDKFCGLHWEIISHSWQLDEKIENEKMRKEEVARTESSHCDFFVRFSFFLKPAFVD